jgi:hypothetical protein
MEKTKTVAWMMVGVLVLLIVIVAIQLSTKQTLALDTTGKAGVISSTNFLKKS